MTERGYNHPITFTPTGDLERDFAPAFEDYEANVRSLLPTTAERPILEVGCGWGQFLTWLKMIGHTAVTGIDVGARQVEFCRAHGLDATRVEDTQVFLEERPDQYELIVLHHVIEHMPASLGLALLRRVWVALRPGGRVVIQTPNMSSAAANIERYIEITHETGYTESSLSEILSLAGFEGIRVFGNRTTFKVSPRRIAWLAARFLGRMFWRALLFAELGTDAPRCLEKNIYGTGLKGRSSR